MLNPWINGIEADVECPAGGAPEVWPEWLKH